MMTATIRRYARNDRGMGTGHQEPLRHGRVTKLQETTPTPTDDPFGRLTQLVASNDRLLAELAILDSRLSRVNEYLATSSPNLVLGRACSDFARSRRSKVLAILRANRIAAREFFSR